MAMSLILWDTHCHLNDEKYEGREADVLSRAEAAGVVRTVVPAYDVASVPRTWRLAEMFPDRIIPAIGMHPWYLGDTPDWEWLLDQARRPGCAAIGEIGLDGYPDAPPLDLQERWFRRQLGLAREMNLPALIHCRRAFPLLLRVLGEEGQGLRFVMHAFGSGWEVGRELVEAGGYLSFTGVVTRSSARRARNSAEKVPSDRLLLETDAPCIAVGSVPGLQVEPCHVRDIAHEVAAIRGTSIEAIAEATTANARQLFGA